MPESGAGCVPISASTFYRRLKVSRARHGSDPARHEREVRGRRAGFELAEDGTACLWVTGDGPRVVAAHRRIDTMARAARRAGDPRTLDQLRSDLIVDLLLYGIVATDLIDDPTGDTAGDTAEDTTAEDPTGEDTTGEDTTERGAPERASTPTGGPPPGQQPPEHEPAGRGARVPFAMPEAPAPGPAQRRTWDLIGTPPPALVHVVVSLDTLTGTRPGVGELPGHGFLPADQTRELCLAAGSTWRRLVTDPASGHLVELTSTSYQAPPALAAQVDARDHLCRGPGCTVPAPHCDFDHDTDHAAGGKTSTSNGSAKHRRHHNLKTRRLWHTRQHPDGTITW
ncbi:MAG TPA: HNH endonuclease signature motif containing protein, partial [Segeticoccus sp.]